MLVAILDIIFKPLPFILKCNGLRNSIIIMTLLTLLSYLLLILSANSLKSNLTIWIQDHRNSLRALEFMRILPQVYEHQPCVTNTYLFSRFVDGLSEKGMGFQPNTPIFYIKQLWDKLLSSPNLLKRLPYLDKNMKSYDICHRVTSNDQNSYPNRFKEKPQSIKICNKQTFNQHPYLINNIQSLKLTQLLNLLPSEILENLGVRRYVISDQRIYEANYSPHQTFHFTKLLTQLIHKLPDVDFIVFGQNIINQQIIHRYLIKRNHTFQQYDAQFQLIREVLVQLPGFMWSKDLNSDLESNKLLIPSHFKNRVFPLSKSVEKGDNFFASKMTSIFSFNIDCLTKQISSSSNQRKHNLAFEPEESICKFHSKLQMESLLKQYIKTQPDDRRIKYLVRTESDNVLEYLVPWAPKNKHLLFKQENGIVEWYFDQIKPNVHYISIKADLSDLLEKYTLTSRDRDFINSIVQEANKFSEFRFTPQRISEDFIKTLSEYAEIQNKTGGTYRSIELSGAHLVSPSDYVRNQSGKGLMDKRSNVEAEILYFCVAIIIILLVTVIGLFKLIQFKFQSGFSNLELVWNIAKASNNIGKRISSELLSI